MVLAIVLCAAAAFLVYTLNSARPPQAKGRRTARRAITTAAPITMAQALPPAAPADVEYSRYEVIVQRNVFAPPAPPPPPVRKQPLPPLRITPPKPSNPTPPGPPPPPPPPSFPGWSYLGYVEINGKMLGILENAGDRSVEYVAVGDTFRGAKVDQVTPKQVQLSAGGAPATLARTETFNLVPLTKAAAPGKPTARPAAPRPAQPAPSAGPAQPAPGPPANAGPNPPLGQPPSSPPAEG